MEHFTETRQVGLENAERVVQPGKLFGASIPTRWVHLPLDTKSSRFGCSCLFRYPLARYLTDQICQRWRRLPLQRCEKLFYLILTITSRTTAESSFFLLSWIPMHQKHPQRAISPSTYPVPLRQEWSGLMRTTTAPRLHLVCQLLPVC